MVVRGHLTQRQKAELMLRQGGKCAGCGCRLMAGLFEHDHICDLQFEGDNALDNWQILCTSGNRCHQAKTRAASKASAKAERIAVGGKTRRGPPMPGSRSSNLKKHMDGSVTRR